MLNLITKKTNGGRLPSVRESHYSVTGAASVQAHGIIQSNAALYHNFGCFVTGRAPVLPFDPNLSARDGSRVTAWFSRAVWTLLIGLLAFMLVDMMVATASWWQVESKVLADAPALINAGAAANDTAARSDAAAGQPPLLQAAAGMNLKQALAADDRATMVLPALGNSSLKYTWFLQISDFGRMMYQAFPDPDGLPLTANGDLNIEL